MTKTSHRDEDAPETKASLGFLRRLWPRMRPYKARLVAVALLIPMSTAIGLAFPMLVGDILDAAFEANDSALLNRITLGLLVLFAFQAVVNFAQSYLTASVSERVIANLRKELFEWLVHQPPAFYAARRVGELNSRLASDIGLIQGVVRFGIPEITRQTIFGVGALVMVTVTDLRLTLAILVAVPFAAVVGWVFGRWVRRLSTGIQDVLAAAMGRAEEVFTQIRTVQAFNRQAFEAARFGAEIDETRDRGLQRAVARAALSGAVTFAASAAIVMVVWQGGQLVLSDELSAGTLVAFLLYVVTFAGAVMSLAGFWANLQEAAGAAKRVFELLDHPRAIQSPPQPTSLPLPVQGEVAYEDVWFRYAEDQPWILKGIDFRVAPGERVALVGSSGVGKTTTASLLPRFFDPERGQVTLDGVDVRTMDLKALRSLIGLVPQEPMLFAGTVAENLRYGGPDATDQEVEEAARAAHAHGFVAGFPNGYEERVGERGVTLSAGQRQRLAIARVMLERPRVLVLDEASAALDSESESLVQDALDRLMAGRTTLVIAHRLSTVLRADRIVVLDGGVVVDQGQHTELLDRCEVYDRLYRREFNQVVNQA